MKILKISALTVLAITTSYCTKETTEDLQQDQFQQQEVSSEILSKLETMGFDTKKKPPTIFENKILVEGDILLSKKKILEHTDQKQAFLTLINCRNATNIRVQNNLGNTEAGRQVINAMNLWNNVQDSNLRFVSVTFNPDITFIPRDLGSHSSFGEFPSNGRAGREIVVNTNVIPFGSDRLSPRQWRNLLAHELGHNIGLLHNNDLSLGALVSGTPTDDANSIMNSNDIGLGAPGSLVNFPGLSNGDQNAVRRMYSNNRNRFCR